MAKKKLDQDPLREREASKYEFPVPSRLYILQVLLDRGYPMAHEQLCTFFELEKEEEIEALRRRLLAMTRDGQLVKNRRGDYGLIAKMHLLRGVISAHREGYGFLLPEDGSQDLFITPREMRPLMDGDRVVAAVSGFNERGRREANIVEIISRNIKQFVGELSQERGLYFVLPHHKQLTQLVNIPEAEIGGAMPGQVVAVEILSYPTKRMQATGRVIEILGEQMAPGMEVDVAIRAYDLPYQWSQEVLDEVADVAKLPIETDAVREDLRHLPFVTIDGEDARDFDDAVYGEPTADGGWCLRVAIADVSHYVQPGSALDKEAHKRGNSVYFPNHVLPMLPPLLSDDLCSLKPNVDRYSVVCEMQVTAKGVVTSARFFSAIICSKARLTYTAVAACLEHTEQPTDIAADIVPHLQVLQQVYFVLLKKRKARGAIDFDVPETRVLFTEHRKIEKIITVERTIAHRMIEEYMLAANVAVAQHCITHKLPVLFRVHDKPKLEKLVSVRTFLADFGLQLQGGDEPEPLHYAKLLKAVAKRPDAHLIHTALLRSMCLSVYSPDNIGHFGLAYPAYAHFTSPIRRYPDLLLHRVLKQSAQNQKQKMTKKQRKASVKAKPAYVDPEQEAWIVLGEHCSMTERRADEATRDVHSWLKCEYMLDKVGEVFSGVVSSVKNFGLFVELVDVHVEGLLHISMLSNDYYHFDPVRHVLTGERTGATYQFGVGLKVRVIRVDLAERKIDFELADAAPAKKTRKPMKQRSNRKGRKSRR